MSKKPVDQQKKVGDFYAGLNVDVSYYSSLWHILKVSHLMNTDLDRVCRQHGLSIADAQLLGSIRVEVPARPRATDMAQLMNISNAMLSTRLAKLEKRGLLCRHASSTDKRAVELELTEQGTVLMDVVIDAVGKESMFVQSFKLLNAEDQQALARIMGLLHNELDRHLAPINR